MRKVGTLVFLASFSLSYFCVAIINGKESRKDTLPDENAQHFVSCSPFYGDG